MEIYTGLIMEYLIERATNINPKDDLEKLLKSKKNLRVKLGVDPTAPDVTLGWYAILRMLRKFQDYGHTAVLILGEFTAQVGDPSGKSETRKVLEENEIDDNAKGVLPIIKNILNDNIYGPGNITKALGIDIEQDGENLLDGSIALSPRIHPVDRAIAKQRKNSKPRDKHLWRFTLVL